MTSPETRPSAAAPDAGPGTIRTRAAPGLAAALLLVGLVGLGGCGVLAAPCRLASTVIKMVPVVGHAAALPTDACAAVIDP